MNKLYYNRFFSDSYIKLISDLVSQGVTKSPRGQNISHIQNCVFSVEIPRGCIFM